MKKLIIVALYATLLLFTFVACTEIESNDPYEMYNDTNDPNYTNDINDPNDTNDHENTNETNNRNDGEANNPGNSTLQDSIFLGDGGLFQLIQGEGGGLTDGYWLDMPFPWVRYTNICGMLIDFVGNENFDDFRFSWHSLRNAGMVPRADFNIRMFIDYFGITFEDYIGVWEEFHGMSMQEVDKLVYWAREAIEERHNWLWSLSEDEAFRVIMEYNNGIRNRNIYDENGNNAWDWDFHRTTAEIAILFSDCVYELWEAFPGYGVILNGRVYTPEWILQNTGRAVLDESIPTAEIERIFELALEKSPALADVVAAAQSAMESAVAVLAAR